MQSIYSGWIVIFPKDLLLNKILMDRNGGINFCIEMCWRYVSLQKRLEVRRGDLGLHNPIRPSVPISLCDRERKRGREREIRDSLRMCSIFVPPESRVAWNYFSVNLYKEGTALGESLMNESTKH